MSSPTADWDARSIWIFKTKQIFFDQSILSVKKNYAEFSHTNYPNIAPAFSAGLVNLIGYEKTLLFAKNLKTNINFILADDKFLKKLASSYRQSFAMATKKG